MPRERLLRYSVHTLDGHRTLSLVPFSVSTPRTVSQDHGVPLGNFFDMYAACGTRKRVLFLSKWYLWGAISFTIEQASERALGLESKPRNFDRSILSCCKAMTPSPLEAIAAMTQVRVENDFVWKQKRPEPLGAHPFRDIMQL